jgi:DNA-binding transcriptional regulator GbsR (MarR family)
MSETGRIIQMPKEIEELADQIGQFIQYWGFKKIHGQIWTHVWLADKPIDATTLVKRLQVSKALVSLAIKDLIHYDVVRVLDQGDRRKTLLVPNEDTHTVISNVLAQRETMMLQKIRKSQKEVSHLNVEQMKKLNLDAQRISKMSEMTAIAQVALAALIKSNLDFEKFEV